MSIQLIKVEDVHQIAPLFDAYRVFYGQESNVSAAEAFLKARLVNKESIILVAIHNGQYAGFTQLYPTFSSIAMKSAFILNDLFVAENFRRMGIAEQLMKAAFQYAKKQDARFITLETGSTNLQAQALYEKMGMIQEESVKHYIHYW